MKLRSFVSSAIVASTLLSSAAMAADGTITFTGLVTASACTAVAGVSTGGAPSKSATIVLPNVSTTAFSGLGDYTGYTQFNIQLTGCQAASGLNNVRALFDSANTALAQGDGNVMANTAPSGAANVGVAILTPGMVQIDLNGGTSKDPGDTLPATSGNVTLNYLAAYKALAATGITAGPVTGVANYTISYF
ncbi:fimbrial protein [Enterobacter sp. KE9933]|uniref:fimbrial protein n=1 Tax=Enterobacter sp. KE9933 TaxID=3118153 RepID=UPI003753CA69